MDCWSHVNQLHQMEHRSHASHRHQMEWRRETHHLQLKTKLLLAELKASGEELCKLFESMTRKTDSHKSIPSLDSTQQSIAQTNDDDVIEEKLTDSEISDDVVSQVVEEQAVETSQHELIGVACDQKILNDKFIVEGSRAGLFLDTMVAPVGFTSSMHQSSLPLLSLNDNDNIEEYSQDEGNDRHRGIGFVSILQVVLLEMKPCASIKIMDENHVFKPGGVQPYPDNLSFSDLRFEDESS